MSDFWGIVSLCFMIWLLIFVFVEPVTRPETVAYAETKCKANGGWKYIEQGHNVFSTVYCQDGAEFNYNSEDLEKDEHL